MYCSTKDLGKAFERQETGSDLGILFEFMKGWHNIWSSVNLFEGSTINILDIRFLALCDTLASSLNVYWHSLILL